MAYNFKPELSFIESQTAATSASIVFTSGISTNFENYVVKLRNVVAAAGADDLKVDFSVNGGSTYLSSGSYAVQGATLTTISRNGANGGPNYIALTCSTSSGNCLNGELFLNNLQDASNHIAYFSGVQVNNSGNISTMVSGIRNYDNTASVNCIKFSFSTGNITSGTFILYGVNEP